MCFFDRQGIPKALVRHYSESKGNEIQVASRRSRGLRISHLFHRKKQPDIVQTRDKEAREDNSSQFDDDLLMLRNYCFVSVGKGKRTFEMHALVQLATKKWLEAHGQLERWRQQSVRNLCAAFPSGEYENWMKCEELFPHTKLAAAQRPEEQDSLKDWASILYKAAWYAWRKGYLHDAEVMSLKSMEARSSLFGQKHEDTLNSIDMASYAYSLGGQWDRAEELAIQVTAIRKNVLGLDNLFVVHGGDAASWGWGFVG